MILKDGLLKAPYLTNIINEGDGIYDTKDQKFIYFSVIDDLNSKYKIYSDITLYFDTKILWNRTFFIAPYHSGNPDKLNKDKKKYKQYYKNTNSVLNKLFNNSISKNKVFQPFQQIAIKKQVNLKYLQAIKFNKSKPSKELIKLLTNEFPNIIILTS
jgi:hypothetical protein